jgi:hypothetical protein
MFDVVFLPNPTKNLAVFASLVPVRESFPSSIARHEENVTWLSGFPPAGKAGQFSLFWFLYLSATFSCTITCLLHFQCFQEVLSTSCLAQHDACRIHSIHCYLRIVNWEHALRPWPREELAFNFEN